MLNYFAEDKEDNRNYLERFFDNDPYTTEDEYDQAVEALTKFTVDNVNSRAEVRNNLLFLFLFK